MTKKDEEIEALIAGAARCSICGGVVRVYVHTDAKQGAGWCERCGMVQWVRVGP